MCEECGCHGGADGDGHGHGDEHDHGHARSHADGHGHDHDHHHGHPHTHEHTHADGRTHSHEHDHAHDHEHADSHVHDETAAVETDGTVRIAVCGKGGVGKSTLSAAIARHLAADQDVVAVDADPDMNLARTLGVDEPPAVTEQRELVEERAGRDGLISLTPEVEDVLESHSADFGEGGRLLTIGAPTAGDTGCLCPENSFVRSLVSSALDEAYVVMDMEAGVEHLGRGTAEAVDAMVVVVEPSRTSIETAARVESLAADLGVEEVRAVVNKTRGEADVAAVREALEVPVVATLPYDEGVAAAGLAGESPVDASERLQAAAADVVSTFRTRDEA